MKIIIPGHRYLLGKAGGFQQTLAFVMKRRSSETLELKTVEEGTTTEEVLEVIIDRTKNLNDAVPCRENSIAITKLEEALMWLNARTKRRVAAGVEGTAQQ